MISFSGEALAMLWKRFVPSMLGIGIREINLIADALMASFLPIGSITALGYGNRLMQLPLGIFAISASTAVLPMYSRLVSRKEYAELSRGMRFTTLNLAYIMLPVSTLILILAPDFVDILFNQGAFDNKAALMTSQALVYYSLGLIFYSLNQTLTPLFYAHGDTKTPVKLAAMMVVLNIALNAILMQFIAHRGLALSTAITALVNYLLLRRLITKKLPEVDFSGIYDNLFKCLICCLLIYVAGSWLAASLHLYSKLGLILKSILVSALSFTMFYGLGILLKLSYFREATASICKRLLRK